MEIGLAASVVRQIGVSIGGGGGGGGLLLISLTNCKTYSLTFNDVLSPKSNSFANLFQSSC